MVIDDVVIKLIILTVDSFIDVLCSLDVFGGYCLPEGKCVK